jgi:Ca-activated chloride channel homolog
MKVSLNCLLNDANVDATQTSSQRQLSIAISAIPGEIGGNLPLNLCLILDRSGSMAGEPLRTVKEAVERLLDQLRPDDRISIVAFNSTAEVIVPNQYVEEPGRIKSQIRNLEASGTTTIHKGLQQGIAELNRGVNGTVSQAFLLTDGHGDSSLRIWKWEFGTDDNKLCLELAAKAAGQITINTLGFGNSWNQNLLEKIADVSGGTLSHIERPEQVVEQFGRLFRRIQSVGLTNAYLLLSLIPAVRLAELKPIAQVAPDVIELPIQQEGDRFIFRLGDLMKDISRIILANLYISQLPEGKCAIAQLQIRYDDPVMNQQNLLSPIQPVEVNVVTAYKPTVNQQVQQSTLALAKYRQTQLAETKLEQGDRAGAATMLQTAAKTALQMGDHNAATVLQSSATRLESGQDLTEADRKKTRIASKTKLE